MTHGYSSSYIATHNTNIWSEKLLRERQKYILYYGAVECLNLIGWRTFWGAQLFSGKRTTNVVPGCFLDRITWPYHFAKWFLLFQKSYNRKIIKTHNETLAKKINTVNKRIKSTDLVHVFATKLRFIMYGKHMAYSLSLTDTLFAHTLT